VIYGAVFLLSLSSLAYEVLLPRVFAFTQWHHLAFLVISIAVFGFGAGGAVVSLAEAGRAGAPRGGLASRLTDPSRPAGLGLLCLLFCLSGSASLAFLLAVPLDYFRLPVEARQAGYLALTWLLLLLPFLLAGAVQALAFAALPERSGWLYAAGMAGGACGALLPPALLSRMGEVPLALVCLALPGLPWVLSPLRASASRRPAFLLACGALAVTVAPILVAFGHPPRLRPSPYKLLAQAEQLAGTRHLGTESGLSGRVDWLDSPALRFAPGMSLAFPGGLPQPEQAVIDGDALVQLFPLDPEQTAFCRYSTAYAAYALREPGSAGRVLVLLESGGLSLPCAAAAGAESLTVAVRQPAVARRLARRKPAIAARELAMGARNPALRVLAGNPRSLLARLGGGFDLVQLESWGPSAPGAASLEQDHLLTLEGIEACLRSLAPGGRFTVSRRIQLPPSDSLRLLGAAFGALRRLGVREPARNIAMLRSWDTYTLIAGLRPFGPGERARLARFCEQRSFDLLFLEGLQEAQANRFVRYARPYHYLELRSLGRALGERRASGYYRGYLLDVRPATDERPFPNRYLKPGRAGELYRATGRRPFSLLLSGEAVLLATLALALAIGLPLLLVAGLPSASRGSAAALRASVHAGVQPDKDVGLRAGVHAGLRPGLLYFLACGAGYMWVEMATIQDLTLLFAQPAVALATALAALLVFSGAGAAASRRWQAAGQARALAGLLGVLAAMLVLRRAALGAALGLAPAWRFAAVILALGPVGFLMGVPLPTGLRRLGGRRGAAGGASGGAQQRAYAWAANGITGTLASVLALPLAMAAGIRWVYLAGAGAYLAAALAACLPLPWAGRASPRQRAKPS
jgi:hypothetical protein